MLLISLMFHCLSDCRMLCSGEDLEALIAALERRGAREGSLYASLVRCKDAVLRAMPAGGGAC